jgi:protein phosphatase
MNFATKFRFANHTDVGKTRKQNEDSMGFFEAPNGNGYVFIVCDGMGGHLGGAVASQTAIKAIRYFLEQEYFADAREAIKQSLIFANQEIYHKAQTSPDLKNMGTTAVMVIYRDGHCYIGHVGDSRLYLYRDGLLSRLTKDHSFVQMLVDQGVITDDEAEKHPRKNEILRALGTEPRVEPEVRHTPFTPNIKDVLLLCSDGLNSMLSDFEIEGILDESRELQDKAVLFINSANAKGGLDNITVQLVEFLVGNTPPPISQLNQNPHTFTKSKLSDTNPLGITTPDFPEEGLKKKW